MLDMCRTRPAIHFSGVVVERNKERRGRIVRGERAHRRRAIAKRDIVGRRDRATTARTASGRGDDDELLLFHSRASPERSIGEADHGRERLSGRERMDEPAAAIVQYR